MQYALRAFNEQFHNLIKATQSIADEQEDWIDWIWKRESYKDAKRSESFFLHLIPLWGLTHNRTERVMCDTETYCIWIRFWFR